MSTTLIENPTSYYGLSRAIPTTECFACGPDGVSPADLIRMDFIRTSGAVITWTVCDEACAPRMLAAGQTLRDVPA